MFALINKINAIPGDSIGTIVSFHRTVAAAEQADDKFQRQVKRSNGQNSYIPTRIREITNGYSPYRVGQHVHPDDAQRPEGVDY